MSYKSKNSLIEKKKKKKKKKEKEKNIFLDTRKKNINFFNSLISLLICQLKLYIIDTDYLRCIF